MNSIRFYLDNHCYDVARSKPRKRVHQSTVKKPSSPEVTSRGVDFLELTEPNGFCSKICSSKRLLVRFEDIAIRQNHTIVSHSSINCLQNGTKVALNTIVTIDG